MHPAIRVRLGTLLCLIFSLFAAFFVVFNSVFSDVFGIGERLMTYALTGAVYLILGFFFGLAGPKRVRRWTIVLSAPAVFILVLYTFSEFQNILIHAGFAALVPLASYGGGRLGARFRLGVW